MYHPVKTMQDFTKSLSGIWLNPRSKDKFYFSADKSKGTEGEILVVQHGLEEPIPLHFNLSAIDEKIYLTVEGERYNVSLRNVPASTLYIRLSPDRTLRLLKRQ